MAVEAHHLHHLLPSHLLPTRYQPAQPQPHAHAYRASPINDGPCSPRHASHRREVAGAGVVESQRSYQYPCMVGLVPQPAAAATAQYSQLCTQAAAVSESGVTFGNAPAQPQEATRKRKRADEPLLGSADVAAHVQQELLDVDRLVLHHAANMWAELAERRRRHARQIAAAVEVAAAKRLRAKDEEIEKVGRLNWALEERLKSLYVEAQVWRDLAQSNEAAASALRAELEQVLEAQAGAHGGGDTESCCCGENGVPVCAGAGGAQEEVVVGTSEWSGRGRCRGCGEAAAEVLLLPCRHLCVCAPCAAAARACPGCGCAKNGTVSVNFS